MCLALLGAAVLGGRTLYATVLKDQHLEGCTSQEQQLRLAIALYASANGHLPPTEAALIPRHLDARVPDFDVDRSEPDLVVGTGPCRGR